MWFVSRCGARNPATVAVLAGAFNPPTVAHAELIRSAAARVDEVLCVLPGRLPHKESHAAMPEERLRLLTGLAPVPYSVAMSDGGLLIDIARECREHLPDSARLFFICGRDAAERIMTWDYGQANAHGAMLQEFELLVAPRGGDYAPPREVCHR